MDAEGRNPHRPPIPKMNIPDYKNFKIDGIPELEAAQKYLASKGLKDPWMRNEAWRYDPKIWGTQTMGQQVRRFFLRGFRYGFAAFLVTTSLEIAYGQIYGSGDDHGHGHDHH